MGLFSKIKNLISKKKDASEKIEEKNANEQFVEQKKFDSGLKKSTSFLKKMVDSISVKNAIVDADLIEKIEELLLLFDVGPAATQKILDAIVNEIKEQNITDAFLVKQIIVDKLFVYYIQNTNVDSGITIKKDSMNVILVTGVNGVGKTTTIAKMANMYKKQGNSVMVIAADTFRAGAVKQLELWATKIGVDIHIPSKEGQDPASVVYAGLDIAKKNDNNVILIDTSGRLQNKVNLMNELAKIWNVIKKFDASQPCESLLILDGTSGQNSIVQAKAFNEITKLTGVIITKMDSTSKGGIVLSIKDAFNIPVKFMCFGEKLEDIEEFDLEKFINSFAEEFDKN